MKRIAAWWRLFRPGNAAIAAAGVGLGYACLPSPRPPAAGALWGALSLFLLTAAGNADNDACDVETDRVNRPLRSLPAGLLSRTSARRAAWLLGGAAILCADAASPLHGALALGMGLLLLLYNRAFKGLPLVGNLAVAGLCALAVYFPEFPHWPRATAPAAGFAFLATWARELAKDLEDAPGDRAAGLRTYPLVAGENAARKLARYVTLALLILLPVPVVFYGDGWPYAVPAVLGAAPLLIWLWRALARSNPDYRRCQKNYKWAMLAGMAALLAGALTGK